MATPTARVRGGYEYKFVEEPPHGLKCAICLAVARQPQQHGECGALFCMSCLTQHRQTTSQCPNCSLELDTFYDGKSDQEVKRLQVKCENFNNGCQWVGELKTIDKHIRNCECAVVNCPNHCEGHQSRVKLLRKDLNDHLTNCPNRTHQCPHCNSMGPYKELTTSHLDSCPKVEVQCPNPSCDQVLPRCYLDTHVSLCQSKVFPCKFAKLGCAAQLLRSELQAHEEDNQLHLQLTKDKVLELTEQLEQQGKKFRVHIEQRNKEIASLRRSLSSCESSSLPVTFKFRGFDEHKLQDKKFWSPSFYLKKGYRFQIVVYANGHNTGRETHVSVFVSIARGVNDDSLTWPFTGSVKVELLNQISDKNHLSVIILFPADESISGRMVEGRDQRGWGKDMFVSNKKLAYNSRKKRQYLMKDTLYFRVCDYFD